jgi:hypothetical protein
MHLLNVKGKLMTDKQTIEPCMGCSALECWGVVDCDVAQRVLALHKTLTEIKEIAEKQCNICEELTPIDEYKDCKKCWQGKILQKISEVLDDR